MSPAAGLPSPIDVGRWSTDGGWQSVPAAGGHDWGDGCLCGILGFIAPAACCRQRVAVEGKVMEEGKGWHAGCTQDALFATQEWRGGGR